jgi:hypothetical protein
MADCTFTVCLHNLEKRPLRCLMFYLSTCDRPSLSSLLPAMLYHRNELRGLLIGASASFA